MFGDLGGVMEILRQVIGLCLFPISTFSFTWSAIKKLYLLKSNDICADHEAEKKNSERGQGISKYIDRRRLKRCKNKKLINQIMDERHVI